MVGVVLKYDGYVENIIYLLLHDLISYDSFVDIKYWESIDDDLLNEKLNNNISMKNKYLLNNLLNKKQNVNPIFLKMLICERKCHKSVDTYGEFLKSNYYLSIVIIDTDLIEICCKNEKLLTQIIGNFKKSALDNKKVILIEDICEKAILGPWRKTGEKGIMD